MLTVIHQLKQAVKAVKLQQWFNISWSAGNLAIGSKYSYYIILICRKVHNVEMVIKNHLFIKVNSCAAFSTKGVIGCSD